MRASEAGVADERDDDDQLCSFPGCSKITPQLFCVRHRHEYAVLQRRPGEVVARTREAARRA
jgi:hypothetical protein